MNRQKAILLAATLVMIAGAGWFLEHLHSLQRLGKPGVKTRQLAGSQNLEVVLPEHVLDCDSEVIPPADIVTNMLPADTSFGQRHYKAADGLEIWLNVVLMGADRTSLHKPQFCLEGQGWQLGPGAYSSATIPVQRPYPYELLVGRLIGSGELQTVNGEKKRMQAVYVYYYVADGALSASSSGAQRMWWMARDLIRTGVLQRWAYVSYMAICPPGQEEATFERMKTFIAASAPEFQLTPAPHEATVAASK